MMYINCPHCGFRDEDEFHYGGPAHAKRPEPAEQVSDEEWMRYLFIYTNRKGIDLERWCHEGGCRQWFNIVRDTVTHEIKAVYLLHEKPPAEYMPLFPSRTMEKGEE